MKILSVTSYRQEIERPKTVLGRRREPFIAAFGLWSRHFRTRECLDLAGLYSEGGYSNRPAVANFSMAKVVRPPFPDTNPYYPIISAFA